jgi:hypothetical protein
MKKIIATFCLLFSVSAFAAPPSDASLNELLAVTNVQQMLSGMDAQMNQMMNGMIQQSLNGKQVNQAQQKAINNMKNKMSSMLRTEYAWEKIKPNFMRIYRDSFTQEEVNGMIAFYKTPSGKAVINKMPVVMQKTMVYTQTMVQGLMPKMQKIQHEFIEELKAAQ